MSERAAVRAFVDVCANSPWWRGPYQPEAARIARETADQVACAALGIEQGELLRRVSWWASGKPPYYYVPRQRWITDVTAKLLADLGRQ